ncbi:hypothetical protein PHMEG_00017191 [Phytophthora megakarya]|uniref:Uncharacterized protein n=1 Tax=Phytophthora megakarya TaxID=4795 RepID=A0A225VX76_9STRA|nr:hypothetical protein PHMEG_00017191 [Phytophthora megakarya]
MKGTCDAQQFSDEAIVILDFKIKQEPLYSREKLCIITASVECLGMTFDDELGESVETKLYFDQICNGDNKHDKEAVVALVEALLLSLQREVPHIKRLTFQSDNASSYQNSYIGLMLPIVGAAHGFTVQRYMHSDTQDGKSMLDPHLSTASRKPMEKSLTKNIDRTNDILYDYDSALQIPESGSFSTKKNVFY